MQSTGAETSPASSLDITGRSLSLKTRIDDVELLLGYSLLLQRFMSVMVTRYVGGPYI